MSYATDDFTESLHRVELDRANIERVVAAWGKGDGMGEDAGHYRWAEPGATDWRGGFLMRLRDGHYAYLTGWCDYTGWGCQDGAELTYYDTEPALTDVSRENDPPQPSDWDIEPADLNRWLSATREDT